MSAIFAAATPIIANSKNSRSSTSATLSVMRHLDATSCHSSATRPTYHHDKSICVSFVDECLAAHITLGHDYLTISLAHRGRFREKSVSSPRKGRANGHGLLNEIVAVVRVQHLRSGRELPAITCGATIDTFVRVISLDKLQHYPDGQIRKRGFHYSCN